MDGELEPRRVEALLDRAPDSVVCQDIPGQIPRVIEQTIPALSSQAL